MKIAIIPGDGVGPELISEITKVIDVINSHYKSQLDYELFPFGAAHFIKYGENINQDFLNQLKNNFRGVLIGALGDPSLHSQAYVKDILSSIIHSEDMIIVDKPLTLFSAELSKIKGLSSDPPFHMTLIRDSIEGLEVSGGYRIRSHSDKEIASDTQIYDQESVRKIVEYACKKAEAEKFKQIPLILRRPLFPNTHKLWEKCYLNIMQKNNLAGKILEVPAFLHQFISNPQSYPIILAPGFTGEILNELVTEFIGGKLYSSSMFCSNENKFLVIPDHGPQNAIAGSGQALPFAALYSLAIIYKKLNMISPSRIIIRAIIKSFESKWLTSGHGGSMTTDTVGNFIAAYIDKQLSVRV